MTDPYIQINGTKIEVFDNDLSAVRTLKELAQISGWMPAGTLTYASAVEITVASGAALIYQKGDKIMFTQHGVVKKMYVIIVADTAMVVIGGSDYVVEDTATYPITLPYYSHIENPMGFPTTFNFTTTPTTTGNAYTNAPTINSATFSIVGNIATFQITWTFNATSGGTGMCIFTVPITMVDTTHGSVFGQMTSGITLWGSAYGALAVAVAKYDSTTCIANSALGSITVIARI